MIPLLKPLSLLTAFALTAPALADSYAWNNEDHHTYYGDFNGDGVRDVFLQGKYDELYQAIAYGEEDAAGENPAIYPLDKVHYLPDLLNQQKWHGKAASTLVSDFNGDGIADIAVLNFNGQSIELYAGSVEGINIESPTLQLTDTSQYPFLTQLADYQLHVGHFVSPTQFDLLMLSNESDKDHKHYIIHAEAQSLVIAQKISSKKNLFRKSDKILIGDFNRDGLDDLFLQAYKKNKKHHLVFNDGKGQLSLQKIKKVDARLLGKNWHGEKYSLVVSDINDDDFLEIVRIPSAEEEAANAQASSLSNPSDNSTSIMAAAAGCDDGGGLFSIAYSPTIQAAGSSCDPVEPPSTPTSISVPSTDNDANVTISWIPSNSITGEYYRLQKRFNGGSYSQIAFTSSTSYNYQGMANGSYTFRVKACIFSTATYQEYCSGYKNSGTLTVNAPLPPSAPTLNNLGGDYGLGASFTASWSGTADTFVLEHKAPNTSSYSTYASTSAKSRSVTINNYIGQHCFRVYGKNGSAAGPYSASKCAYFTLTPVNLSKAGTISFNEDSTRLMTKSDIIIDDSGGDSHTLYVYSNSNYTANNNVINPTANFSGGLSIKMRVKDNHGVYSPYAYISVTVNAINDAPIIGQGSSTSIYPNEDVAKSFTLTASDIDSSTLTWSQYSAPGKGTVSVSGTGTSKSITYTPNTNSNGSDSFKIRVTDNSLSDIITVSVNITSVNDAPVISQGSSTSIYPIENVAKSFTLTASDIDSSTLTWSQYSAPGNGTVSVSGTGTSKSVTYTPNTNYNGSDSFRIKVTDNSLSDTITVYVTVSSVNYPPTGSVTITGNATEDQTLVSSNTLADTDGLGTVNYQWNRNGIAISGATGTSYILVSADVGTAISVTASYTDGEGKFESKTSASTALVEAAAPTNS